jgi:uncharacterized protein (TIGR02996 family)
MSDRDEPTLLRAVIDEPDDDVPRLAYADWLDEHGQPDRAELVRVQLELARLPAEHLRRAALVLREGELLGEHEERWAQPLRRLLWKKEMPRDDSCSARMSRPWLFSRGFVEAVAISHRTYFRHAKKLFSLAPVRDIWFVFDQDEGEDVNGKEHARLARSPHLARLRTLDLSGHIFDFPREGTEKLLASPHLHRLETLYLRYGYGCDDCGFIQRKTVELLASGQCLPGLRCLDLTNNEMSDVPAEVLAAATKPVPWRRLSLRGTFMTPAGVELLASAPALRGLEELDLSYNDIDDRGAEALARSPHLTKVKQLWVPTARWCREDVEPMTGAGRSVLQRRFGDAVVFVD